MGRPRKLAVVDTMLSDPAEAPEPARTPARQKLADAIATLAAREIELAETNAALSKAEDDRHVATVALREAELALERAKPRPDHGFARPRGPLTFGSEEAYLAYQAELNTPPIPIDDAVAAVERAENVRQSTVRMEQFLQRRLDHLVRSVASAKSDIRQCLRLAVHFDPALAALATETRRLVTRAASAVMAFETATGGEIIQSGSPFYGCTKPADVRSSPEAMDDWAVSRAWSEAMERLSTDPDAALPT